MQLAQRIQAKSFQAVGSHMDHDQNWRWPEKTWFRERLNAVKAREHEQRRKCVESSDKPDETDRAGADTDKKELKVD